MQKRNQLPSPHCFRGKVHIYRIISIFQEEMQELELKRKKLELDLLMEKKSKILNTSEVVSFLTLSIKQLIDSYLKMNCISIGQGKTFNYVQKNEFILEIKKTDPNRKEFFEIIASEYLCVFHLLIHK